MPLSDAFVRALFDLPDSENSGSAVVHFFKKVEPLNEAERAELRDAFEALGAKFAFTFKVKISDFLECAMSLTLDIDRTNQGMREAVDCVYQAAHLHYDHAVYTPKIGQRCINYVHMALRSARKDLARRRPARDLSSMSDDEFIVWFTYRLDGNMECETRIDANPRCPREMIDALSKGNADEIWGVMQRSLCYFPLLACKRVIIEHLRELEGTETRAEPTPSPRVQGDARRSDFASADAPEGSGESTEAPEGSGKGETGGAETTDDREQRLEYIRCQ